MIAQSIWVEQDLVSKTVDLYHLEGVCCIKEDALLAELTVKHA